MFVCLVICSGIVKYYRRVGLGVGDIYNDYLFIVILRRIGAYSSLGLEL